MSVSKRLRFEILKRDGFRCKYCGRTAIAIALEVDHVVPVSEGGTDDPENLITACFECNRGKGPVPLDESRIQEASPLEVAREHAAQIREYMKAYKRVEKERQKIVFELQEHWACYVDQPLPDELRSRLRAALDVHPIDRIFRAIKATGTKLRLAYLDHENQLRYFHGCLRTMADREGD